MTIHGFTSASNHYHLLFSPEDAQHLAAFMRRFQQKLSTEVTRLHGRKGPMWEDGYHAVVIENDERVQLQRLRSILSHGVEEGRGSRRLVGGAPVRIERRFWRREMRPGRPISRSLFDCQRLEAGSGKPAQYR